MLNMLVCHAAEYWVKVLNTQAMWYAPFSFFLNKCYYKSVFFAYDLWGMEYGLVWKFVNLI